VYLPALVNVLPNLKPGFSIAAWNGLPRHDLPHPPRDIHNGARLTGDLMIEHHVDDHHVFPQAYLAQLGVEARPRACVLNRTLIDRKTNIRISNRAPSVYLREIRDALGPDKFQVLLESHHLPGGIDSPLWRDDFDAYLDWRQKEIWKEIQEVTGVREAADLVAEAVRV
jgi:hypothetical protein